MRRRGGGDEGVTLLELLIAIAIISIGVVAILGAWGANLRFSARHRNAVDAQAVASSTAERLQSRSIPYRSCFTNANADILTYYEQSIRYLDYTAPNPVTQIGLPATWSWTGTLAAGTSTVGAAGDSDPAGKAEAFQTTASASGLAGSISFFLDNGTTASSVVVGLYTDAGGKPGSLLTQGTLNSPPANSWSTASVAPVAITAGTTYWISVLQPQGSSGNLKFRDTASGTPSQTSSQTNLSALPSTWATGSTFPTNGLASAYASILPVQVLAVDYWQGPYLGGADGASDAMWGSTCKEAGGVASQRVTLQVTSPAGQVERVQVIKDDF